MHATYKGDTKHGVKSIKLEDPPAFGEDIRNAEFSLIPGISFLNQGSFGAVPKRVMEELRRIEDVHEGEPDGWFRRDYSSGLTAAREAVAAWLGADPGNLAFDDNTTKGINNILKHINWSAGDIILRNNWTYGAVNNIIEQVIIDNPGVDKIVLQNPYPISSEEQVLQVYEETFQANPNIKVAVIDHISSTPAVVFPVKALTALCHQFGVLALIDGAHGPGHVHINLEDMAPDFYCASIYKWCYTARTCGVVYVNPSQHNIVKPVVTSFLYQLAFPSNHGYQGTRNLSSHLAAPAALSFYDWIGGLDAAHAYCTQLLEASVNRVSTAFGTSKLQIPASMEAPYLRAVEIPDIEGVEGDLAMYIREKYGVWTMIFTLSGTKFVRMSGNIYCTEQDFIKLEDGLRDLVQNGPDPTVMALVKEKYADVNLCFP